MVKIHFVDGNNQLIFTSEVHPWGIIFPRHNEFFIYSRKNYMVIAEPVMTYNLKGDLESIKLIAIRA